MEEGGEENKGYAKDDDSPATDKLTEVKVDLVEDKKNSFLSEDCDAEWEDGDHQGNVVGDAVQKLWDSAARTTRKHWSVVKLVLIVTFVLLFNIYFIAAIHQGVSSSVSLNYCEDVGFLIIITCTIYFFLFYFFIVKRYLSATFKKTVLNPILRQKEKFTELPHR